MRTYINFSSWVYSRNRKIKRVYINVSMKEYFNGKGEK